MDKIMEQKLQRLGEVIDALVAKDYTARGISHELYDYVRKNTGAPLCMSAMTAFAERVKPGDRVMIFTGWPSRSWLIGNLTETDGPVGAAILARALEEAFHVIPILVMAPALTGFGEIGLRSAGLIVSDLETAMRSKPGPPQAAVAAVVPLSTENNEAARQTEMYLDKIAPAALISIELPGANSAGCYHNVTGREVPSKLVMKADEFFRRARCGGIMTIGIGDGGNELGMANAAPAIAQFLKNGAVVAPATPVDHLVVSCISNWGALGMAACAAAIKQSPELFTHIDILRITEKLSDAGAIDGLTAYVDPKNDGTSQRVNQGLTDLMAMTVRMHIEGWNKE